ncbi:MAG: PQQ-binding-like beta-propeller repeat protein [Deltaproteobacteria bacterium]|nr:PQQ-binding-like beta-propeller repeat protein [Deltaproteobacteria bacterium]
MSTFDRLRACIPLSVLALVGCPATEGGQDTTTTSAPTDATVVETITGFEVIDFETAADASAPDATGGDAPDDADTRDATGDASPADTGGLTPGAFGWPCDDNDECDSGYCIEGYAGRQCSETCTDRCAEGWSCRLDLSSGVDDVFVCVQSFPNLCRPCDDNATCARDGATGARCLPRGDDGAFCGGACTTASCPSGYTCKASVDVGGEVTPQCVPDDGAECACSPRAIADGATTMCRAANTIGVCAGERQCTAAGLTACDAPAPATDLCNGLDDDCDGQTDEAHAPVACVNESAFGACPGTTTCAGLDGPICDGPTPVRERCGDAVDGNCDGEVDAEDAEGCVPFYVDGDGDRFGVGVARCLCAPSGDFTATGDGDCDDTRGVVRPDAAEVCDGLDNDCDGQTDDEGAIGCTIWYHDGDGDGFGDPATFACLCAPDEAAGFTAASGTDCDDEVAAAHPAAPEACDGVDNDCDTLVDEEGASGCATHFVDGDLDTWGDPTLFACLCAPDARYPVTRGGDCDDGEAAASPSGEEACGDAIDNDCDGQTDELGAAGCVEYRRDSDGDTFGAGEGRCLCAPAAPFTQLRGGDCDDAARAVNPEAPEACNGKDDNCDQVVDEAGALGCETFWLDADLDGFGLEAESACLCAAELPYGAARTGDCDDASPFVNPEATEVCNLVDDDCNGATDEGVEGTCSPFFYDGDGDGWGLAGDSRCLCGPDGMYRATKAGDCDDAVASTHPFAGETCNAVDDDCDGGTDEAGAQGCTTRYHDADDDGFGRTADARCLCAAADPYTASVGGDCDDAVSAVNPAADEVCNDADDDCDGVTDPAGADGCVARLRDSDRDGFGVTGDTLCLCDAVPPFDAAQGGDCNDADPTASPAASETCNGKDDDCSGVADDPGTQGCVAFYRDDDQDTFGASGASQCLCAPAGAWRATIPGDCDDARDDINPALTELCNGQDDDCDTFVDERDAIGCEVFLRDADGDQRGVDGDMQCLCEAGPTYRATAGGDCDDGRASVYAGAPELCAGGRDDDCDGQTDEQGAVGCASYHLDVDGDAYGRDGDARCLCAVTGNYRATEAGDCNDGSPLVSPAASEYCNGTDDDCDSLTDEEGAVGCQGFFVDGDEDGWGVGAGRCLCGPSDAWTTTRAGDCADAEAAQNPGLPERCGGDGRDEDCDGQTDEPQAELCADHYTDVDDDGYGVTTSRTCTCGPSGDVTATVGGDCDDDEDLVSPGRSETCNAQDDDCDGLSDEGCGLMSAAGSWPTSKYDRRRSGWGSPFVGPQTKTLKWRRQILANYDIQTSAVFDGAGRMYIPIKDKVYRLSPTDGATIWSTTLPAEMSPAAGATLRDGGTIVVPAGNRLVMLDPDGQILWTLAFPGSDSEPITGSPMVDSDGTIYVAGFSAMYAVDPGGSIKWAVPVPNQEYVQSHVAWSPTTDRLYFGCSNHTLFAVTRAGMIAWTYVVLGEDVDASTLVAADGTLWQSFGNRYHHVRDDGNVGTKLGEVNNGNDNDTPPVAWTDAAGNEHVIANANGATGLKSWNAATHALEWTYSMTKDGEIPNTTPAIDKNGTAYVGDDQRYFHAVKADGTRLWRFESGDGLQGTEIQSTVALQPKAVIFGDNRGWLYWIADP